MNLESIEGLTQEYVSELYDDIAEDSSKTSAQYHYACCYCQNIGYTCKYTVFFCQYDGQCEAGSDVDPVTRHSGQWYVNEICGSGAYAGRCCWYSP